MDVEQTTKFIEAAAKLIGAVAWPAVVVFALCVFAPSIRRFLSSLSEVRLKGRGFEASAVTRLDFDATSQKLYDFWKPGGRIDRSNARRISACMRELGMVGSVSWLMNAGTPEDRARVAALLAISS